MKKIMAFLMCLAVVALVGGATFAGEEDDIVKRHEKWMEKAMMSTRLQDQDRYIGPEEGPVGPVTPPVDDPTLPVDDPVGPSTAVGAELFDRMAVETQIQKSQANLPAGVKIVAPQAPEEERKAATVEN